MRAMGIDCGSEITGYGVVEETPEGKLHSLAAGCVRLGKHKSMPEKMVHLFSDLNAVIAAHQPDVVAIEDVFYSANVKSALKLGHVRGVAMLAAAQHSLPVAEYAPLSIKSAVVGYGRAEKFQVQQMVTQLLNLPTLPEPPDVADALAIAICHLHTAATLKRQARSAR